MNCKALLGAFAALILTIGLADTATAQSRSDPESRQTRETDEDTQQTNAGALEYLRPTQRRRNARPPSQEQINAAAQAQIAAAGLTCQLIEAINPGSTAERIELYEVACANDAGYIIAASAPPQAFNCVELQGQNENQRERDPAFTPVQECVLPGNQNTMALISGWAQIAGVPCAIDQGRAVGTSRAGNIVYEVGCANQDGYWMEKEATGWKLTECMQVMSSNGNCRFTTVAEQIAGFEPKLAGTEAAGCNIQEFRLMGFNANGRFVEVRCAAPGVGYVTRLNTAGALQQVYPCANAAHLGGGCTLTPVAAAAPAAAPGGRP